MPLCLNLLYNQEARSEGRLAQVRAQATLSKLRRVDVALCYCLRRIVEPQAVVVATQAKTDPNQSVLVSCVPRQLYITNHLSRQYIHLLRIIVLTGGAVKAAERLGQVQLLLQQCSTKRWPNSALQQPLSSYSLRTAQQLYHHPIQRASTPSQLASCCVSPSRQL